MQLPKFTLILADAPGIATQIGTRVGRAYTALVQRPPFTALAAVYDRVMADVDYEAWAETVLGLARERGYRGGRVLDLGCGTGNAAAPLLERGLEVTGVDASAEMLAVARAKLPRGEWVLGDFRTFALPHRFGLAQSVFDAVNNLLDPEAFLAMARNVHAHLLPGGPFVFDANTSVGLRDLWHGDTVEGWAEGVYYRWVHSFDPDTGLARVEAFCETPEGAFTEVHHERPYDPPELEELLTRAGFRDVEVRSWPDGREVGEPADRVWVVAVRPDR